MLYEDRRIPKSILIRDTFKFHYTNLLILLILTYDTTCNYNNIHGRQLRPFDRFAANEVCK